LIENGKPEKTIAWILIIVFLPVIGLIVYFFFGQKFNKEKNFVRLDVKQQSKIKKHWLDLTVDNQKKLEQLENQNYPFSKVFQYLYKCNSSPIYYNDELKVLINGEEKFPEFLEAIRQAKNHIHLEYYIFDLDIIGQEIIDLLIEKSNKGVEVRIMIDDFGSPKFSKKGLEIFKNSKVEFQVFLPVHFTSLANSNYRNHRKILIVDAEIAFVGGINISDKYLNIEPYNQKNEVFWRDTSLKIQGESIDLLQLQFWLNWTMTDGELFDLEQTKYHFRKKDFNTNLSIDSITAYAFTSPGSEIASAMESMILAISLAKEKVRITTPYFIPSEEFKSALLIAISSGIEVDLILPKKGDSIIVQQASLSFLKPIMKRGLNVFLYEKGFVHAKTMLIDDQLAFVGTVNLDNRSFFINFEISAVFQDKQSIDKLIFQHDLDVKNSMKLTYEKWKSMNVFKRGFASVCRLLAPIL